MLVGTSLFAWWRASLVVPKRGVSLQALAEKDALEAEAAEALLLAKAKSDSEDALAATAAHLRDQLRAMEGDHALALRQLSTAEEERAAALKKVGTATIQSPVAADGRAEAATEEANRLRKELAQAQQEREATRRELDAARAALDSSFQDGYRAGSGALHGPLSLTSDDTTPQGSNSHCHTPPTVTAEQDTTVWSPAADPPASAAPQAPTSAMSTTAPLTSSQRHRRSEPPVSSPAPSPPHTTSTPRRQPATPKLSATWAGPNPAASRLHSRTDLASSLTSRPLRLASHHDVNAMTPGRTRPLSESLTADWRTSSAAPVPTWRLSKAQRQQYRANAVKLEAIAKGINPGSFSRTMNGTADGIFGPTASFSGSPLYRDASARQPLLSTWQDAGSVQCHSPALGATPPRHFGRQPTAASSTPTPQVLLADIEDRLHELRAMRADLSSVARSVSPGALVQH